MLVAAESFLAQLIKRHAQRQQQRSHAIFPAARAPALSQEIGPFSLRNHRHFYADLATASLAGTVCSRKEQTSRATRSVARPSSYVQTSRTSFFLASFSRPGSSSPKRMARISSSRLFTISMPPESRDRQEMLVQVQLFARQIVFPAWRIVVSRARFEGGRKSRRRWPSWKRRLRAHGCETGRTRAFECPSELIFACPMTLPFGLGSSYTTFFALFKTGIQRSILSTGWPRNRMTGCREFRSR